MRFVSRPLRAVLVAVMILAAGLPVPTNAAVKYDLGGGKGRLHHRVYGKFDDIRFSYLVYMPEGWKRTQRLPLYVAVHGCGTSANQFMGSTLLNRVADRERFLVVYPDNEAGCWRAVSDDAVLGTATGTPNITRGAGGDVDIVAGITKRVLRRYNANRNRVYMAGMSSGAFQASATAAAYPELFAAVGVSAGPGPGMAVTCVGYHDSLVPLYAQKAVAAMGRRAHVMPFFAIGGTRDPLGMQPGVGGCARLAYLQWIYINNLLKPNSNTVVPGAGGLLPPRGGDFVRRSMSGVFEDTYRTDPYSTKTGQKRNGYRWTRYVARDHAGCEIAQKWVVHGMSHYWPGGSRDPKYTDQQAPGPGGAPGFNDPKAPSGSELTWRFFKQFTLKGGNTACRVR
jgi:poly(3-hydroxybutyrate) depolymerase